MKLKSPASNSANIIRTKDLKPGTQVWYGGAKCLIHRIARVIPACRPEFDHLRIVEIRNHPTRGSFTTAARLDETWRLREEKPQAEKLPIAVPVQSNGKKGRLVAPSKPQAYSSFLRSVGKTAAPVSTPPQPQAKPKGPTIKKKILKKA